jgi:membrane-associated phospholipid phosphatase
VAELSPTNAKSGARPRALVFQIYLVVAVVVFLILAVLAKAAAYFPFDVTITQELQEFNPIGFGAVMYALSWIGFAPQVDVISLLILLFLYIRGLKWETVVAFASIVGVTILGTATKLAVDRPRPSADLVNVISELRDYSFPSGHVLYFMAFFGFLFFLAYTFIKHTGWRNLLLVILGGMLVLIGPSRIYEGQHWASDVLASYLLGSVWLTLTIYFYRRGKQRFSAGQSLAQGSAGAAKDPLAGENPDST